MNSVVKFVKSSAVYFLGSVMTKVISFFLLPLYTNYISTADFGYYDLSISYINVLVPVICMEIWSGIMRYMFDFEAKEQKYHAIFNGMVIFSGSVVLYALIGVVLGLVFDINMLFFIFLYGFFSMLQNIYSYTVRGLGYNASFAISGILGSLIDPYGGHTPQWIQSTVSPSADNLPCSQYWQAGDIRFPNSAYFMKLTSFSFSIVSL